MQDANCAHSLGGLPIGHRLDDAAFEMHRTTSRGIVPKYSSPCTILCYLGIWHLLVPEIGCPRVHDRCEDMRQLWRWCDHHQIAQTLRQYSRFRSESHSRNTNKYSLPQVSMYIP